MRKSIRFGLATLQLKHSDPEIRRESLRLLSGSLEPVKNLLIKALEKNSDGTWVESETDIREQIAKELENIEFWEVVYSGIKTLFFGFSLGSVLLLAAIGLSVTFGVMGVIIWLTVRCSC